MIIVETGNKSKVIVASDNSNREFRKKNSRCCIEAFDDKILPLLMCHGKLQFYSFTLYKITLCLLVCFILDDILKLRCHILFTHMHFSALQ